MGLDMYMYKKTYVKNWSHMQPKELHKITVKLGGKVRTEIKPERISRIIEDVAYWRKANQIHKWFVDNVQGGADDCKEYYVPVEKLRKLVDMCKTVLTASELVDGNIVNGYHYDKHGNRIANMVEGKYIKDATVANELLPTQSGFFFGSTDYDEYYLEDIKNTVEQLEPLLNEKGDGDFYYSSSW